MNPLPPGFLPIAEYPRCQCDWGDTAVLLFEIETDLGVVRQMHVGWLEAGMWFYADPDEPFTYGEFDRKPIAFMPLPIEGKGHVESCTA